MGVIVSFCIRIWSTNDVHETKAVNDDFLALIVNNQKRFRFINFPTFASLSCTFIITIIIVFASATKIQEFHLPQAVITVSWQLISPSSETKSQRRLCLQIRWSRSQFLFSGNHN